jgi:hypothetical protein
MKIPMQIRDIGRTDVRTRDVLFVTAELLFAGLLMAGLLLAGLPQARPADKKDNENRRISVALGPRGPQLLIRNCGGTSDGKAARRDSS